VNANQVTPRASWPVACKCGETWKEAEWIELPAIGCYHAGRDGWLELRTCMCGSALSIPAPSPREGSP
jgi:hypothetical protein